MELNTPHADGSSSILSDGGIEPPHVYSQMDCNWTITTRIFSGVMQERRLRGVELRLN